MSTFIFAEVSHFKNIINTTVEIDKSVTCLVGKNESGKTSFMEALYRVHPAKEAKNTDINVQKQYPAWLEKRHRRQGRDIDEQIFAVATFQLTEDDRFKFDDLFGKGVFLGDTYSVAVQYDGKRVWRFDFDEQKAVKYFITSNKLKKIIDPSNCVEISDLIDKIDESDIDIESKKEINQKAKDYFGNDLDYRHKILKYLKGITPIFLYFAEYSQLPGSVNVNHVLTADDEDLDEGEITARTLLTMAGAADDYLRDPDYETRKRELENVSNDISQEILDYWSTNEQLRMLVDITQKNINQQQGKTAVVDEVKFRIWDDAHRLSLPLEGRSSGFIWFFSFLAAFSEYEYTDRPIVILLDEPGLGLHARAQKDFLRFIDERLAPRCQVMFTTHSPFMVQADHLERVRLVEDKGQAQGAVISADIMSTDPDTLFPLQGALGYDLVQHLLIGPHNLLVEGPSDHTYLIIMSDWLKEIGKEGLDDRYSIVVAGGLDCIPTFVALLGQHLNISVMIDSSSKGHQRLESFKRQGLLSKKRIVTIGGVLNKKYADIEDVFSEADYLHLYNGAFESKIKLSSHDSGDRVVSRICRVEGIDDFNHRKPSNYFLRKRETILHSLSQETIENFENLFTTLNKALE